MHLEYYQWLQSSFIAIKGKNPHSNVVLCLSSFQTPDLRINAHPDSSTTYWVNSTISCQYARFFFFIEFSKNILVVSNFDVS